MVTPCFSPLCRKDFPQLYCLMEEAFPQNERRTRQGQETLLDNPAYHVLVEKAEDGVLRAFLTYWKLDGFIFAEHFAVNSAIRGGGLGSKMLRYFLQQESLPVILEVEHPETEIAARRIGFYERLGFHLNLYDYVQPAMQENTAPLALYLMSYPSPLSEDQYQRCKKEIYQRVYRVEGNG